MTEGMNKQITVHPLGITVSSGEVVALVGVKDNDISKIFKRFYFNDPVYQQRRRRKNNVPAIQCIKRSSDLFKKYSVYDNFLMTEKVLVPYKRKQLIEICNGIVKKYRINIDLDMKVEKMTPSEKIIVEAIRTYLINPDVLVLDSLFSRLGFEYIDILVSIIEDLREQQKAILYLTTKWEDAIKIATRIYVVMDDVVLGEMSAEEVKKNPQHLIFLLSGRKLMEEKDKQDETSKLLSLLYSGAEYLTNNYELKDALGYVSRNIAQVLDAKKAIIYLYNDDSKLINSFSDPSLQYSDELNPEFVRHRIRQDGNSEIYYTTFEDANFNDYFKDPAITCKTLLCMPIYNKSKPQGLLQVIYDRYFVYDELHVLYMKSFCKEIAVIIETSRLMGNSILLQESNHRIKNNLQTIVNIISLQQIYIRKNKDCDVNEILSSIIDRIQNTAALHEFISSDLTGESAINLKDIIDVVLKNFEMDDVKINIDIDNIFIPYAKATSISMIINELITNSYKYAFKGRTDKQISISCNYDQNRILIKVSDNGIGLPEGFDINHAYGIGYSIIRSVIQIDLHGTIQIETGDYGTMVTITILPIA